jgi:hypothetical protein
MQVVDWLDELPEELQPYFWHKHNLGAITVGACPYCTALVLDAYKHLDASKSCFLKLNQARLQWNKQTEDRQCQMS